MDFNSPEFWEEDLMEIARENVHDNSGTNFHPSAAGTQSFHAQKSPESAPCRDTGSASFGGMPVTPPTAPPLTLLGNRVPPRQPVVGSGNQAAKKTPLNKPVKKSPAPPKPNVAQIYAERLLQKADYKKELLQAREKWKMVDLDERKQARLYESNQAAKRDRLMRKHQLEMEKETVTNAEKKACLDRYHQWQMARAERRSQMLIELSRTNKSDEQIKTLMALVDD